MKVNLTADPANCGTLFDPVGVRTFTQPCDVVRRTLANSSIHYDLADGPAGSPLKATVNGTDAAGDRQYRRGAGCGGAGGRLSQSRATRRILKTPTHRRAVLEQPRRCRRSGILFMLVLLRDDGLRADRRAARRTVPDPHPLHRHVAALSHRQRLVRRASCRRPPSRSWRRPAISSPASGIRSSSPLHDFVIGLIFLPETKDRDIYAADGTHS